jgi:hypothetical protein
MSILMVHRQAVLVARMRPARFRGGPVSMQTRRFDGEASLKRSRARNLKNRKLDYDRCASQ